MPKPTLLQTILNQPSQRYVLPQPKEYFSAKDHMFRVAGAESKRSSVIEMMDGVDPLEHVVGVPPAGIPGHKELTSHRSPGQRYPEMVQGIAHAIDLSEKPLPVPVITVSDEEGKAGQDATHSDHDIGNDTDISAFEDSSDSDSDVFYTPNTSPRTSMVESFTAPVRKTSKRALASMSATSAPTSAPTSASTSSASLASASLDSSSIFSLTPSDSTRLTIPLQSDAGYSSPSPIPLKPSLKSSLQKPKSKSSLKSKKSKTNIPQKSYAYTDEDWAKEVRWLVPPASHSPPQQTHVPSSNSSSSSSSSSSSRSRRSKTKKPAPSIMTSMTALLELEEEDNDEEKQVRFQPQSSNVLISPPTRYRGRARVGSTSSGVWVHNASIDPPQALPLAGPPVLILVLHFDDVHANHVHQTTLPSNGTRGYTTLTLPRAPPPTHLPSSSASLSPSNAISTALALLTEPGVRAGGADGKVDLTRSGVAQTTMASVEVVRGLGAGVGPLSGWHALRASLSAFAKRRPGSPARSPPRDERRAALGENPLAFTSMGVGVDGVDARLVCGGDVGEEEEKGKEKEERPSRGLTRSGSLRARLSIKRRASEQIPQAGAAAVHTDATPPAAAGYTPGRSFVGRVLECGWAVRDAEARRGDWVVGMLGVKEAGALREFVVVDRRRVGRVGAPVGFFGEGRAGGAAQGAMTLEELALLPLCGVPAYRAVRTFVVGAQDAAGNGEPESGKGKEREWEGGKGIAGECKEKRRTAFVINGHDGTGAMAVQMLVKRGWKVILHAPSGDKSIQHRSEVEVRARGWGVDRVVFGRVAKVLADMKEEGVLVDAVLDTVGGRQEGARAEWEGRKGEGDGFRQGGAKGKDLEQDRRGAKGKESDSEAEGVIGKPRIGSATKGHFTTLFGDAPWRVIPRASDHFRAGIRALKNGAAGRTVAPAYAWVSGAQDVDWEGRDVRGALEEVVRAAREEGVRPWVGGRVVRFEEAPSIFNGGLQGGRLRDGGVAVVRVVG
ncbi:hypothetical protein BD779DRAFT_1472509 [Infundibulicybe gibba]|nr:hypothetical protein BD779DRAFT_1472509 [Infundibulicybe gibba]